MVSLFQNFLAKKASLHATSKRLSEGERAWRQLAKYKQGKKNYVLPKLVQEVFPGLEFLLGSVATDYSSLNWQHIRPLLRDAFLLGV
jgi:hypothetical protein